MGIGDVVGDLDVEYASDLTDGEGEEECALTPRALERVVPRSCKRTYGVVVESEAAGEGGRKWKRSRVDEQFELLRAAIPCSTCTNERASILAGAYEYILKLQRQLLELNSELYTEFACSDGEGSSCEDEYFSDDEEDERPASSNAASEARRAVCRGCSHPTVEVVSNEVGLRIHIECDKRPHILVNIMEFLESIGMIADQVSIGGSRSIAHHGGSHFVFDCVGSKVAGKDIANSRHLEACLRSLIAGQRDVYLQ